LQWKWRRKRKCTPLLGNQTAHRAALATLAAVIFPAGNLAPSVAHRVQLCANVPCIRPPLLTPLNISHRSGVSSNATNSTGKSRVPMFRCFVKGISSSHVVLVLLPASFQDLKLLTLSDSVLLSDNPPYVTKVAPDPRPEEPGFFTDPARADAINDEAKLTMTTDGTSTFDEDQRR